MTQETTRIPQTPRWLAGSRQGLVACTNMAGNGEAAKTGKVKAIGVANYSVRYLEQLLPHATIVPAVNQIENHPSLPQQEIVDFCKLKGIHITAYSPLGSSGSPMLKEPPIVEVAKKCNVTPASVLLSYHRMYSRYFELTRITDLPSCSRKFRPCEVC
jgi:diketogulonate reductase-like aldo/keto reductase